MDKQKPRITGHLWNGWIGIAGELSTFLKAEQSHSPQDTRETSLYYLIHKKSIRGVDYFINTSNPLQGAEAEKALKLRDLEARGNQVLTNLAALTIAWEVVEDPNYRENYPDGPFLKQLKIPADSEQQLADLLADLKNVCVEVNELLYEKKCEFFGRDK